MAGIRHRRRLLRPAAALHLVCCTRRNTMRKTKAFRPLPVDVLEDRAVPSGDGWLGSLIGVAPAVDAQQVARAFATFERSYNTDVQTILFKSGTTPTAQRSAFDAQVATDLTTLETAVDGAITNL